MKSAIAFAAVAAAAPHHETHTFTASEFVHLGPANATESVRFSVALPWSNWEALEAKLADISDPQSPRYTQWMTQTEVNELTAPAPALRAQAADALKAAGADCAPMPHSMKCTASVAVANALFKTQISAFEHAANGGARVLRVHPDTPYAFPDALRGAAEFVTSLVDFPTVLRKLGGVQPHGSLRSGAVDYAILPESLKAIYGTAKGSPKSSQCPVEFQADAGYAETDLAAFAKAVDIPLWKVTHTTGPNAGGGDLEATLDEQYMGATGISNDNWYWTVRICDAW